MNGLLGKKVGMTQIFTEDGLAVPVTIVAAGPCLVVQRKTTVKDGYEAVQLGLVEGRAPRRVPQPQVGHFALAKVAPMRKLEEFEVGAEEELKPGDQILSSIFGVDDYVDVRGKSKGKGFQGVIKRHGFGGGKATHGSMFHRAPGSIGQASDPARVFPGVRLPGQMGAKMITTKNLRIVKIDDGEGLLYIRGAVPGPNNGYVSIRKAKRG